VSEFLQVCGDVRGDLTSRVVIAVASRTQRSESADHDIVSEIVSAVVAVRAERKLDYDRSTQRVTELSEVGRREFRGSYALSTARSTEGSQRSCAHSPLPLRDRPAHKIVARHAITVRAIGIGLAIVKAVFASFSHPKSVWQICGNRWTIRALKVASHSEVWRYPAVLHGTQTGRGLCTATSRQLRH
jgi:hypothetical protein